MITNNILLNIIKQGMLQEAPRVREDAELFRGFGFNTDIIQEGFIERREWAEDGYRHVTVNEDLLATLTYCEGDIILSVSPTKAAFKREMAIAKECYEVAF